MSDTSDTFNTYEAKCPPILDDNKHYGNSLYDCTPGSAVGPGSTPAISEHQLNSNRVFSNEYGSSDAIHDDYLGAVLKECGFVLEENSSIQNFEQPTNIADYQIQTNNSNLISSSNNDGPLSSIDGYCGDPNAATGNNKGNYSIGACEDNLPLSVNELRSIPEQENYLFALNDGASTSTDSQVEFNSVDPLVIENAQKSQFQVIEDGKTCIKSENTLGVKPFYDHSLAKEASFVEFYLNGGVKGQEPIISVKYGNSNKNVSCEGCRYSLPPLQNPKNECFAVRVNEEQVGVPTDNEFTHRLLKDGDVRYRMMVGCVDTCTSLLKTKRELMLRRYRDDPHPVSFILNVYVLPKKDFRGKEKKEQKRKSQEQGGPSTKKRE